MMGWDANGWGWLGWFAMGMFWLLALALIVLLVERLLPGSGRGTAPAKGGSGAEILDARLASGEIDLAAWRAQRAALQGTQDDGR